MKRVMIASFAGVVIGTVGLGAAGSGQPAGERAGGGTAASPVAGLGARDEAAVRAVIDHVVASWGDAAAYVEPFVEEARFVVVNGMELEGREAIQRTHEQVFATIFKDTRVHLNVQSVRLAREDLAIVGSVGTILPITASGEEVAEARANPYSVQTWVLTKEGEEWRIQAFQNTPRAQEGGPPGE
jgi:uncharacterized protein (TIGR02246 family)